MSAAWTCEQVQDSAAELALGLTVGADRADALAHLERCEACRELVADLTRVVDHLLLVGPVEEPPPGFEVRVLDRLAGASTASGSVPVAPAPAPAAPRRQHRPRQPRRRQPRPAGVGRRRHTARLAALTLAVLLVLGGAVFLVRDRPNGRSNAALREAPMVTPSGKNVGKVDIGGAPATVFVALPGWYWGSTTPTYRLRVVLTDGSHRDLGPVALDEGGTWGQLTTLDPATVRSVAMVDASGHELCHARLVRT